MLDPVVMRRIAENYFVNTIAKEYGQAGIDALKEILEFLPKLYTYLDPDRVTDQLVVIRLFDRESQAIGSPANARNIRGPDLIAEAITQSSIVELTGADSARIWTGTRGSETALSTVALVYRLRQEGEAILVRETAIPIPNPDPTYRSIFARPSFLSLRDALNDYARRMARSSTCYILREAWEDDQRLFAKRKPERYMRRSLHQFLKTMLRDADVQPEQNVDESHPVDVTVSWVLSNRRAIIEIKWLGKSRDKGQITVEYSAARAREGAKQLADYLDAIRSSLPDRILRGYLVVIDLRRRGLHADSTSISVEDGFYYASREIAFSPPYHLTRTDFEEPIRMFIEPVCTA